MGLYRYKETDEVAHIDCLTLKMRINRFIREPKDVVVSLDPKKTERKIFLIAIECTWFENGKIPKKGKFNSRVLVPWHVASQGMEIAKLWLNDNFKEKQK